MSKNFTPEKLAQISAELDADKAQQDAQTAEERSQKAAERAAAKEAKAKNERQPNYLVKIEKLRSRLPEVTEQVKNIAEQFSCHDFTDADLTALGAYLGFEQRRRGILASANPPATVAVGDTVRITNCVNRKFIGLTGTVEKVRRIRAFVRVEGFNVPAYTFVSDLQVVSSVSDANRGTNILDLSEEEETVSEQATGTNG